MVVRISDKTQNYSKITKLLVKPKIIKSAFMHQDMYVLKFMKQDWQVNHLWQICQLDLAVIWDIRCRRTGHLINFVS